MVKFTAVPCVWAPFVSSLDLAPLLSMSRALRHCATSAGGMPLLGIGILQIFRYGKNARLPGGRRALPHGDPCGWQVHEHNHKPVVQGILVA